jgi:hypothetical protein
MQLGCSDWACEIYMSQAYGALHGSHGTVQWLRGVCSPHFCGVGFACINLILGIACMFGISKISKTSLE